jgi:hypothetical protein
MKRKYYRNKDIIENKIMYQVYKKILKSKISEHKNKSWETVCSGINASERQVNWKQYHHSLKRNNVPPTSITDHNGKVPNNLQQSLSNVADYYENVYTPTQSTMPQHNTINNHMQNYKIQLQQYVVPNDTLNTSCEEIELAAKSIKRTTSPGPDNITMPLIINAGPKIYQTLQQLFVLIKKMGILPNGMKQARSVAIFKNKGSKNEAKNYRIISITNVIARIWEKIIHQQLLNYIGSKIPLHQHGFLPTRGTYDAIFQLQQQFETCSRRKQHLTIFFGDITTAYDKVWHEGLILQLHLMSTPTPLIKLIANFLDNRTFFIQYQNTKSNIKTIRAGVPQGCILSPLLFVIYMKTIERYILPDFALILFADDICIFNRTLEAIVNFDEQMQKLDKWAELYKFIMSIDKSAQMNLEQKNIINDNPPTLKIKNQQIQTVEQFKYLGIVFSSDGSWKKHVDYITKKTLLTINLISRLIKPQINTPTPRVARNMIQTLAYSAIRYGIPFYFLSTTQTKKLESIITSPIRKLLRLPRHTRHRAVMFELELPHIQTIKQKDTLNFYNKHIKKREQSIELEHIKNENNKKNKWIKYLKQTLNKWNLNDNNINKDIIKQQHKIREEVDFKQQKTIPSLLKYNKEYKFPHYLFHDKFPILQTRARIRLGRTYINEHKFNHNRNPLNCPLCNEQRDTLAHLLQCAALTHFTSIATEQLQTITPNKQLSIKTIAAITEKKHKQYIPITNNLLKDILTRRNI